MNEIEKKIERLEKLVKILFTEKRITDEAIASILDMLDGEIVDEYEQIQGDESEEAVSFPVMGKNEMIHNMYMETVN